MLNNNKETQIDYQQIDIFVHLCYYYHVLCLQVIYFEQLIK